MSKAIGIDLGTTNSVIAILDRGKAKILDNPTSRTNRRLTPSVVAIDPYGQRLVGEPAKEQPPEKTIFSIKRFMGRLFRERTVESEIERLPYQVTENSQNGEVLVWLNGEAYSPPAISAFILESLKQQAEAQIGEEVTHAVISVPAYFNDRQKRATRLAGELAGLNVMQLISEPTAATLAYGIDTRSAESQKILIYDLGGGTFDTTVFFVAAGVFVELSREGANQLGGDDFDQAIINHIIDQTKNQYNVDLSWHPEALQKLKVAAERAKIQLSTRQKVEIMIRNIAKDRQGRQINIDLSLTRSEYEKLIKPLVDRTIRLVKKATQDAEATPEEIQYVLLVGGSSTTPLIIKSLSRLFGRQKIIKAKYDPMYCVAAGAAIQSGMLPKRGGIENRKAVKKDAKDHRVMACPNCARLNHQNNQECQFCQHDLDIDIDIHEIVAIPLGIETRGDKMEIMIDKGSEYPTSEPIRQPFYTASANQTSLRVPVYQGFSKTASENAYLGVAEGELPWGLAVGTEVEVSFFINDDGILEVEAELVGGSDVKVETKIDLKSPRAGSTGSDWQQYWRQQAQKIVHQAGSMFLKSGKSMLNQEQIKVIKDLMAELQRAITMNDSALGDLKAQGLKQVMRELGQVGWLIYANYLLAHPTQIQPKEKLELENLLKQGIQAKKRGDQSRLDAIGPQISALSGQIRQRIKNQAIDNSGLLEGARSLEEWWFSA